MPAQLRHRADIQGLRAIAVLLVAADHAGVGFLKGGYVGVDVFFVLSGFLITGLLLSGAAKPRLESLVTFYSRRARRILPAAALTLAVTDIVAYQLLNIVRAKQVLQDSIFASLFTANVHFASQGTNYFAQSQPPSPVQQFWSLAVEEQFYLVWPLLLSVVVLGIVIHRRTKRPSRRGSGAVSGPALRRLGIAVGVIACGSLAWSVYYTQADPAAAYFSTFARAWELALGAALALGTSWIARVPPIWRAWLGYTGFVAICAAAVTFSDSTPFPGYAALLPTLGAALVIGAGIGEWQSHRAVGRVLSVGPLRFIGDRSYAFYLWHWPVLIIAMQYVGHSLPVTTNLLLLLGAFLLSVVSYAVVENPIRTMRWRKPSHALVLWPASVLVIVVIAGLGINTIDVKATRLSDAAAPQYPGFSGFSGQGGPGPQRGSGQVQVNLAASTTGASLTAVVGAVNAAQHNGQIPAGLNPPVTDLIGAEYHYPGNCYVPENATSGPVCRFADSAARRSIMLIGDSHAQMWMPAILAMAQRDDWAVLPISKSGCTPPKWMGSQATSQCSGWYKWAVGEVDKIHPTVTLVTGGMSGLGPSGQSASIRAIGALSAAVKGASHRVIVINDPPGQTKQPVDCLLASGATMASCSLTPSEDQLGLSETLASQAKTEGVGFLDTWPWFCYHDVCPMVIGHTIAYIDSGHVSQVYATELAAPFAAAFAQAFRAS